MNEEEREPVTADPDTGGDSAATVDDPVAELEKWKREKRKWEERAKANAEKARQFDDLQESQKSEQQKLADARQEAEQRAKGFEIELARTRVALRKGLTEAQAKRLQGANEEEMEADAEELLATFKVEDDGRPESDIQRRPRERLRAGAIPAAEPEETDPRKLVASLPRM